MANPNPKTEQLALGRGKRPKLDHKVISMRVSEQTIQKLEEWAESYDCYYAEKPWIAGLLSKIGNEELIIVPPYPGYKTTSLSNK